MKKIGFVIIFICAVITALAVIGINLSITGAKGGTPITIQPYQLDEYYHIESMAFPDEAGELKKNDTFAKKIKKMEGTALIDRIRVMDDIRDRYEKKRGKLIKDGADQFAEDFGDKLEEALLQELQPYGITKSVVALSGWDKVCMFSLVYRSLMLIFGFLGIGLGLAIVTSGNVKSDLDQ
ncbi:MAG: hypothetical protein IKG23_07065 [Clostridia bacterium]|nr:hypothetical protein [Clostridia bacterium]